VILVTRDLCHNRGVSEADEEKKLYKIGEVCKIADVQPYVLRYWETEFPSLAPNKSGGGQRLYTRREIDTILRIKQLLYSEGFTIAGAKKKLETDGETAPAAAAPAKAPAQQPQNDDRKKVLAQVKKELRDILKLLGATLLLLSCNGNPTEPRTIAFVEGTWSASGACLVVRNTPTFTLVAGCGHGEFPKPEIRGDGTFEIEGTYRIEAGPVSIDPPPPAHYSGSVTNSTITLRVQPSDPKLAPASYIFRFDPQATCAPRCL
jgi:DNA-binding transcriptional MerR regulator